MVTREEMKHRLAVNLDRILSSKKISIRRAAKMTGVFPSRIQKTLDEECMAGIDLVLNLAEVLDCKTDDLLAPVTPTTKTKQRRAHSSAA